MLDYTRFLISHIYAIFLNFEEDIFHFNLKTTFGYSKSFFDFFNFQLSVSLESLRNIKTEAPIKENKSPTNQILRQSLNLDPDDISEWKSRVGQMLAAQELVDYALSKDRHDFSNFTELASFLKISPAPDEISRAWLVFVWITKNIAYDVDGYRSHDYGADDAESVLRTGKSVCSGYAALFQSLSRALGLNAITISGYSKGFGYCVGDGWQKPDHAWNAIEIGVKLGHRTQRFYFVRFRTTVPAK